MSRGHIYELPPKLFKFAIDYADTEIDDVIFVVFVMSVAMMAYALRRYQDLSAKSKARISAELEARDLARHDPLTGLLTAASSSKNSMNTFAAQAIRSDWPFSCSTLMASRRSTTMHGHARETKR